MKRLLTVFILSLGLLTPTIPSAMATDVPLTITEDKLTGYDRSLFKHWIDADKDGCDTRAEVLIEEAIVKPKVGPKCKLTGGKWLSAYDGKTVINSSLLDVDHMVPLAEAWRSGAPSVGSTPTRGTISQCFLNKMAHVNFPVAKPLLRSPLQYRYWKK